jgi:hypothetical protein
MRSYSAVIENIGPNYLANCILKLSTANKFNLALHDRSWLHDASETFDLRLGQVRTLYILWTETYDPTAPAYPQYYRPDEPDFGLERAAARSSRPTRPISCSAKCCRRTPFRRG